jgi:hypothetical protein
MSHSSSKARSTQLRRDLKRDNSRLHELSAAIEELTRDPRIAINHWVELQSQFDDLRDQLSLHFALEEAEGYLNLSSDVNPEHVCSAEYLKLQHVELFEEMVAIANAACEIASEDHVRVDAVLARYRRFKLAFDAHEAAERNLLQRAYDDIGVGD